MYKFCVGKLFLDVFLFSLFFLLIFTFSPAVASIYLLASRDQTWAEADGGTPLRLDLLVSGGATRSRLSPPPPPPPSSRLPSSPSPAFCLLGSISFRFLSPDTLTAKKEQQKHKYFRKGRDIFEHIEGSQL